MNILPWKGPYVPWTLKTSLPQEARIGNQTMHGTSTFSSSWLNPPMFLHPHIFFSSHSSMPYLFHLLFQYFQWKQLCYNHSLKLPIINRSQRTDTTEVTELIINRNNFLAKSYFSQMKQEFDFLSWQRIFIWWLRIKLIFCQEYRRP